MIEYLNATATFLLLFITCILLERDKLDLQKTSELLGNLKNVMQFVGNLPKWLSYYNDLNTNIQLLRDKTERLQTRMEDIRTCVELEEDRTSRLRKKEVDNWLISAETVRTDVQSLLEQTDREGPGFLKFLNRAWLECHVKRKIQEVDEFYGLGVYEDVMSHDREAVELVSGKLVGKNTKENIAKILAWLDDDEATQIGLYGIKGIGKTAVMKHIHNEVMKKDDFHAYMIQLPMDFREYDLQVSIAKEIGLDLHEEDSIKRAALLHRAMEKRKFVLILDGLTKYFLVENVGIPLNVTRGKMIITSQCPDICRKMGCQKTIAMSPLPFNEAVELFKQKLELDKPLKPHIDCIAMEIIKQCQGMALRIVDKAIDLKRVDDISVWEKSLYEML